MATDAAVVYVNKTGTNPDVLAINATGPSATDGTEFIAAMINNYMFGPQQALLGHAGLSPDGITEAAGTAQTIEAIQKGFGVGPGMGVTWWLNDDPATTGHRVLLLNGQVITIASYQDLVDATYVGDGNNATASAFYKTSDVGGTIRDTAGPFFVLPEHRGYAPRGLDVAASVDPDGASRDIGSIQLDAMQGHDWFLFNNHSSTNAIATNANRTPAVQRTGGVADDYIVTSGVSSAADRGKTNGGITDDGVNGTPRIDSESRMVNVATRFAIGY